MTEKNRASFILESLEIEESGMVDKGDNPEAHMVLAKNHDEISDEEKGLFKRFLSWFRKEEQNQSDPLEEKDEKQPDPAAPADEGENKKSPEGEKTENSMKTFEDVLASLPEESKALITAKLAATETDDVNKRFSDLEKRASEAEEKVAKMEKEKREAACKAKAAELALPGVDTAALADVLDASSEETAEKIGKIFAALKEQVDTSELFKEKGSDAPPEDSATARLEKMASELAEKENIGFAVAYDRVCQKNRDLYKASRKEG